MYIRTVTVWLQACFVVMVVITLEVSLKCSNQLKAIKLNPQRIGTFQRTNDWLGKVRIVWSGVTFNEGLGSKETFCPFGHYCTSHRQQPVLWWKLSPFLLTEVTTFSNIKKEVAFNLDTLYLSRYFNSLSGDSGTVPINPQLRRVYHSQTQLIEACENVRT